MPCAVNSASIACPDYVNGKLGRRASASIRNTNGGAKAVSALVRCANGLSFGVRVGNDKACWPQSFSGPWETVELVDLSRALADLRRYRHHDPNSTYTVRYLHVPVALLNRIIARNGGLT